ncbi:MAG TPA: ABC transporter ATP-binding protein [Candidatus Omnitrophota bacterium]|nr:ABC transporter ATP-binding protein [Candidatus Omnitrophota bacterium]HNQ50862.1 ABC transporter ATP-binding protein [Candidatus Omnitrophota bacterium]HQO37943.1 ABC transporter ATP-binding protein [Candidatus Omnitrophota bacterium]HQQ05450.1 ABC transporter ATP-binding protein [Candidatus Omnitrophota bacterium]
MEQPIVELQDVRFTYPDGTPALAGVDLSVARGQTLGLIGPNGAGKSTLLLHLNGILKQEGSVRICGTRVSDRDLALIRGKVGLVFQDPDAQLFMPTVFDDVAFGPLNMRLPGHAARDAVIRALELVDMLPAMKRSSHHLSFGEKKRISLATVLSMNPEILVLDEPTSNLDPKHRRGLIELLKELPVTKVIATHDLEFVIELCDSVAVLDRGTIVAQGGVAEVLSDKRLLESHGLEVPHSLRKDAHCHIPGNREKSLHLPLEHIQ